MTTRPPDPPRSDLTSREWLWIVLIVVAVAVLWWRAHDRSGRSEGPVDHFAVEAVLRLPPPERVDGPHPHRSLPYELGAVEGFSADQDRIHHGRRQVRFVSEWNELEASLRSAPDAAAYSGALSRLPPLVHATGLHELLWRQMAPPVEESSRGHALLEAVLASPPTQALAALPPEDGWFLVVWDIEAVTLRYAGLEGRGAHGAWGHVPLIAVDLYHHAGWVDHGRDRERLREATWAALQPDHVAARLSWLHRVHEAAGGEPTELTLSPGPLLAEEIAQGNAETIRRVAVALRAAEPEVAAESLYAAVAEVFGHGLGQGLGEGTGGELRVEDLTRWLAWAPGEAVLAWDAQSGTVLTLSVASPESGGVWGAIPLVAVAREERPDDLSEARDALTKLPWSELRERIARLRAVGPGAELD